MVSKWEFSYPIYMVHVCYIHMWIPLNCSIFSEEVYERRHENGYNSSIKNSFETEYIYL